MAVRLRASWILYAGAALLAVIALGGRGQADAAPGTCGRCHAMERYVASWASGRDLDHVHRLAGVGCAGCHPDAAWTMKLRNAAAALAPGDAGRPARRRLGDAACNRCHVGLAHQAVRTDFLRRNPHRSHWPELACEDCHRVHGPQVDFCAGCHENGGQRMTGAPVIPRTPPAARGERAAVLPSLAF